MYLNKNLRTKGFLTVIFFLTITACNDSFMESPVPMPAHVSYSCNVETVNAIMQQLGQAQLSTPGGYVRIYDRRTISVSDYIGIGGLLLLQNYEQQYYAFDLACPYCYKSYGQSIHRIEMADALTASCPNCGSQFGAVIYGSPAPTAGPANTQNYTMRQYRATLMGDGMTLFVSK